jgi:hypothetical protein
MHRALRGRSSLSFIVLPHFMLNMKFFKRLDVSEANEEVGLSFYRKIYRCVY